MNLKVDIRKSGGILLKDRKLLITKSYRSDFYVAPGGKLQNDETPEQSLIRELLEEVQIAVNENDFEYFGTYYAQAAGKEFLKLEMVVFLVKQWIGEPTPRSDDIESLLWINSLDLNTIKLGSIFEHDVLPALKAKNLID